MEIKAPEINKDVGPAPGAYNRRKADEGDEGWGIYKGDVLMFSGTLGNCLDARIDFPGGLIKKEKTVPSSV